MSLRRHFGHFEGLVRAAKWWIKWIKCSKCFAFTKCTNVQEIVTWHIKTQLSHIYIYINKNIKYYPRNEACSSLKWQDIHLFGYKHFIWAPSYITSSFGWARPFHTSFIARSSYPHLCGHSSSLGTYMTIPSYITPLSSIGMWRNFINQLGTNESDVNLNICNIDRLLSHWFPTKRSSHTCAGRKTG